METRYYRALDEIIAEAKDWAAYSLIIGCSSWGERVERLEALLELAAKQHDDAAGEKIASWLFQAMSDAAFAPFFVEGTKRKHSLTFSSETELRVKVGQARAEKAIALWPKLPAVRLQKDRRYADGDPYRLSTMVATKKVVLTEVAKRWAETADEAEADRIFQFFLGIETEFKDDWELLDGVIRKVTDNANPVRLMRYALSAPSHRRSLSAENALKRFMLVAWARRVTFEVANLQFRVLEPLNGSSIACYDLMLDFARIAARLDEASRFLKRVLGEAQRRMLDELPEGYEKVPGELTVSYPDAKSIEARLVISHAGFRGFDESQGHEWFETARRNVLRWQETYPYHVVLTVLVVRPADHARDNGLFQRSQRFAPVARAKAV